MGYQTAALAYPVDCASLYHILKAQHCSFCLNCCFNPPLTPHSPITYLDEIHDIAEVILKLVQLKYIII